MFAQAIHVGGANGEGIPLAWCRSPWLCLGQPWHQDSSYFPFDREPQVAAWLATSEATLENGCLVVLPGSHQESLHDHLPDEREGSNYGYTEIKDHDFSQETPMTLNKGDLLLFHSFLMHKSFDNKSNVGTSDLFKNDFIYIPTLCCNI